MFRLIASNAQQGFKPSLLSKVKHAKNTTKFGTATSQPISFDSNNMINYQIRNNSSAATATVPASKIIDQYQEKLRHYKLNAHKPIHIKSRGHFRAQLTEDHLFKFASNIYSSTINSRRSRLGKARNRDNDQAAAFNEDVSYQTAVLSLAELIASGELNSILSSRTLFKVFGTLLQFKLSNDILSLWESGISGEVGSLYLAHDVLSIVIQVGYESKRFSYEEIKQIYDSSVVEGEPVHPFLSDRIGQVAISEGDHARGLDALESLMTLYESDPKERAVLGGLAQLHLSFIGQCKDIAIAKRFFEKALNPGGLPYVVVLKSPYMVSFLQNCSDGGDSMETLIELWKRISTQYIRDNHDLSSKSATINTGLFKIFFDKYPEPTEEAVKMLSLIFEKCPKIDEVFLNTMVSIMSWNDKDLFQKIVNAYEKYNVEKSIISHRIILKQAGLIEFSNSDILNLWNELLHKLDEENYTYIANADWASLRAATLFSEKYKDQRTGVYFSILKKYKDYMQHNYAAVKFLRNWVRNADAYKLISRITVEEDPVIEDEIKVTVPAFKNLKKNVNYRAVTKEVTNAAPRLIE
ncbi:RMD9 RNA-binding protein RMD9 [Candida maltosa Xu316]